VRPEDLLVANGRFESTTWSSTALGPPLGGAAISLLGPVTTVVADAVSYLLSALGICAIRGGEPHPEQPGTQRRMRANDLLDGWRYLLAHAGLRPLFLNTMLVNSLIMVTAPILYVLMLGQLGFAPWQFGLAFAVPCAGGLIGSRLARRVVTRYGQHRVLQVAGTLRVCWLIGLAFISRGTGGLILVMAVELGMIICISLFNPVMATYRLEHTDKDRIARTLSAWSVSTTLATAVLTALWGLLASVASPRIALAAAGVLILATPLLLPRRDTTPQMALERDLSPARL
jgi:predicted MFS family arabinose efflux permease